MLDQFLKQNIRDKLTDFSSPSSLRVPIFNIMSANQKEDSAVQILSPAIFLYVVAEEVGVSVGDLLTKAERIVKDADHVYSPHMRAIREYIRKELK